MRAMLNSVTSPDAPAAKAPIPKPFAPAICCGALAPSASTQRVASLLATTPPAAKPNSAYATQDAICREAGTGLSHAVKCTIGGIDLADFGTVNEIYGRWFEELLFPARACVQVAALPKGARVEIDAVVARNQPSHARNTQRRLACSPTAVVVYPKTEPPNR